MARISSAAPLLGAALAAALMVAATAGYQAGAGASPTASAEAGARTLQIDSSAFRGAPAPGGDLVVGGGIVGRTESAMADAEGRARLAVIIDDVADLPTAESLWALEMPITLAVLPYAAAASEIAAQADDREIFVHLPMEPVGLEDPGPNALRKSLPPDDFAARLAWAFQRVPGAVGFNNHMGSRLTADREAMERLFSNLDGQASELIFVDSLTHPRSVAGDVAEAAGIRVLRRNVFLDHRRDRVFVDAQLQAALDEAVLRGEAIAIGHPYPVTLDALESLQTRADAAGVELVTVSELVEG